MKQTINQRVEKYLTSVLAGEIIVSEMVLKAIKRHQNDLLTASSRNLKFSPTHGEHIIRFIESFCHHSQGEWAGNPVVLEPWQCALLYILYGWRWADTGYRRFAYAYIELAKGNGKSFLASALALYELVAQGEAGAEVYSVATKKDQARIVFNESVRMVQQSPHLKNKIKSYRDNLNIPNSASRYEPLATDEDSIDGLRPQAFIADELHRWGSNAQKLWDTLNNALGKRRSPILIVITTAGAGQESVCWQKHDYSDKVVSGIIEDDKWFSWVCCLSPDDDPYDESNWIKANPNLGVSVQIEELRSVMNRAKGDPSSLNGSLRLRLGLWTSAHSTWIPLDEWDKCSTAYSAEDLNGQTCFGGLDLSTTTDISAFVLLFPPQGNRKDYAILPYFYLPEATIEKRSKRDRVPYDVWNRQNLFKLTPGNIIDYDFIRADINDAATKFHIQEIAFDPYKATHLATKLGEEDGLTVVEFRQGDVSMDEPCNRLMQLILKNELAHGNNPVLRWMASNVVVRTGATGLIKPDKEHSAERIDGISALLNALGRQMRVQLHPAAQSFAFTPFLV